MKRFAAIVVALSLLLVAGSTAWAQVTLSGGTRTLSPGDTVQAGASSTSSATGGTHIQTTTVTPIQTNTQVNTQVTTQGQQQGQGQHQGQGQQQGQGQGQDQHQKQQANNAGNHQDVRIDVPRQAPAAVPSGLAVSSLTCYGSWSIAASTPFGGIGAGFPTKDEDCERSRNAMIFVHLGLQQVALALLGQNPENAKAMVAAGVKYPGQKAAAIPQGDEPKTAEPAEQKTSSNDIPTAMRATLAAQATGVQSN